MQSRMGARRGGRGDGAHMTDEIDDAGRLGARSQPERVVVLVVRDCLSMSYTAAREQEEEQIAKFCPEVWCSFARRSG